LKIGDVLKVMTELNDDGGGVKRCTSLTRDVACRPERQLTQEDQTDRRASRKRPFWSQNDPELPSRAAFLL
jgi:hypothetical protein